VIGIPLGVRVWLVAGHTDMRRGFDGLSTLVGNHLQANAFAGDVYVFRGRRGDLLKVLWFDGQGLCLLAKRLERGRFVWPQASEGAIHLSAAQLSMLLEGIDWRSPQRMQGAGARWVRTLQGIERGDAPGSPRAVPPSFTPPT
jgi:transposase